MKAGFKRVVVESDAGAAANFPNEAYTAAGADVVSPGTASSTADIVLAVRPPTPVAAEALRKDQTLISFIQPGIHKDLVHKIQQTGATSFAMDAIPRISRAQVFDALSSMANTAGYRAVLEAGNEFGRFFTGQVTAAGKIPPAKVLVSADSFLRG
jgi:NAD(P) transhydrogenase